MSNTDSGPEETSVDATEVSTLLVKAEPNTLKVKPITAPIDPAIAAFNKLVGKYDAMTELDVTELVSARVTNINKAYEKADRNIEELLPMCQSMKNRFPISQGRRTDLAKVGDVAAETFGEWLDSVGINANTFRGWLHRDTVKRLKRETIEKLPSGVVTTTDVVMEDADDVDEPADNFEAARDSNDVPEPHTRAVPLLAEPNLWNVTGIGDDGKPVRMMVVARGRDHAKHVCETSTYMDKADSLVMFGQAESIVTILNWEGDVDDGHWFDIDTSYSNRPQLVDGVTVVESIIDAEVTDVVDEDAADDVVSVEDDYVSYDDMTDEARAEFDAKCEAEYAEGRRLECPVCMEQAVSTKAWGKKTIYTHAGKRRSYCGEVRTTKGKRCTYNPDAPVVDEDDVDTYDDDFAACHPTAPMEATA